MKGVIVKYFEENGFGFIRDENEDQRFFKINEVVNKNELQTNLSNYYYSEYQDRPCFVVNFTESTNNQGLTATKINLTTEVLNDKKGKDRFDAIITKIEYNNQSIGRISSGYTKGMNAPVGSTAGSNGTYRIGYSEVTRELNVSYRRLDNIGWGTIDVRRLVLEINNRQKLTSSMVANLEKKLVGQTVTIMLMADRWIIRSLDALKI